MDTEIDYKYKEGNEIKSGHVILSKGVLNDFLNSKEDTDSCNVIESLPRRLRSCGLYIGKELQCEYFLKDFKEWWNCCGYEYDNDKIIEFYNNIKDKTVIEIIIEIR